MKIFEFNLAWVEYFMKFDVRYQLILYLWKVHLAFWQFCKNRTDGAGGEEKWELVQ